MCFSVQGHTTPKQHNRALRSPERHRPGGGKANPAAEFLKVHIAAQPVFVALAMSRESVPGSVVC